MPKTESEKLVRVHIHIYESDHHLLHTLFDDNMGYSKAIRSLIHKALLTIKERADAKSRSVPIPALEVTQAEG